jgi:hypothetical protein
MKQEVAPVYCSSFFFFITTIHDGDEEEGGKGRGLIRIFSY